MIAGLEPITSGDIKIGNAIVNNLPPKDRDIAMGFQTYAPSPHTTVYENMGFPLKLRVQMRAEIKELHQRLKTTTIYVTHVQVAAMAMADRIVVMHDGIVEQVGTPLALYDKPANIFVAGFIGSPSMNLMKGSIAGSRVPPRGVRWITRTANQDALGLFLPGTAEADGIQRERPKAIW